MFKLIIRNVEVFGIPDVYFKCFQNATIALRVYTVKYLV